MRILAIHRDVFSMSPHVYRLPEGVTLAEMAKRVNTLPEGWPRHEHDVICIDGQVVPQALWGMIKPKPAANGVAVEVTFHAPPMNGGGGSKNVIGIVAAIGLTALTGGVAGGAILGGLTGASAATGATVFSRLLGAGIALVGSQLLSALSPTPSVRQPQGASNDQGPGTASANGNVLEPNTALPRVVGTHKIFPPFVTQPFVYYDGDDEVVEAVAALAGPHKMDDIRINNAPVVDVAGVECEHTEGWPGVQPLSLIQRYARTLDIRTELRGHTVREDSGAELQSNTGDIADATPLPKILTTRTAQDEFWIGINFPQGLFLNADDTKDLRVPFRLRIRENGTTAWKNLPEIHYVNSKIGEKRATIKFIWRDFAVQTSTAAARGWVEARIKSPGQVASPVTSGWDADPYFDDGQAGDDYVANTNFATTSVINLTMSDGVAEINLDTSVFPKGRYEIEIMRGYAFKNENYVAASYKIAAVVRDPFWYEASGAEKIYQTRDGLSDKVFIARQNSVFNDAPVKVGDVALIALKARNVNVDQISVLASGYVLDWSGVAWDTWVTTSNPAPHLRDVLAGRLNARPAAPAVIDDVGLVAWRTANVAAGYQVNAVLEGLSVADASRVITGAGYAKLYQSEQWGAARDYDRSAESPVQYFTDMNAANFMWSKGFAKRPDGFRVTFADSADDYDSRQIIVPAGAEVTEQVAYDGLVTEAEVRQRAEYDLLVSKLRSTFFSFDAPAEAVKCRRGSLIGVQFDTLTEHAGSGRVVDIEFDGAGNVSAITLNNEVPVLAAADWASITDLTAVTDMSLIGRRSGIVVRRSGGTVTTHEISTTSVAPRLEIVTPFAPNGLDLDDLAVTGPLNTEVRRLIVLEMEPREDLIWTITAVAEAPEIWT